MQDIPSPSLRRFRWLMLVLPAAIIFAGAVLLIDDAHVRLPTNVAKVSDEKSASSHGSTSLHAHGSANRKAAVFPELLPDANFSKPKSKTASREATNESRSGTTDAAASENSSHLRPPEGSRQSFSKSRVRNMSKAANAETRLASTPQPAKGFPMNGSKFIWTPLQIPAALPRITRANPISVETASTYDWTQSRKRFLRDIVVLISTGSYHQNCSKLPSSEPCPPDRADLVELATHPTQGWLRGIRHIVISNHPWPPLGVRGVDEVSLAFNNTGHDRNGSEEETGRRQLIGQTGIEKDTFRNDIMLHGVLLANDTFGAEGFEWIVGGDDDTVFMFSKLIPFLRTMDSLKPLFIGVPGPGLIGRWYCAEQGTASRARRGPVCCSNYSEPCPVSGLRLPTGSMSDAPRGQHLAFYREDDNVKSTQKVPFNHCCGPNAAPVSSLVLRPTQCTAQTCCGINHGTKKKPKKVGFREKTAAAVAAHLHWPAGHFNYGGAGWLLSKGLLRRSECRAVWEMCSVAIAGCPSVAADIAIYLCVFNLGFALGSAPPHIFPGTSPEKRSAHARVDELPLSPESLASQTPGTFLTAGIHHVKIQDATKAVALDDAFLRDLKTGGRGSAERDLRKLYWETVREKCGCQLGEDPQEMAIRGTGCVPSNCGKTQNTWRGKGKGACCRCTENQWRAVFSPRCSWLDQ
jgi:hypothetical protein